MQLLRIIQRPRQKLIQKWLTNPVLELRRRPRYDTWEIKLSMVTSDIKSKSSTGLNALNFFCDFIYSMNTALITCFLFVWWSLLSPRSLMSSLLFIKLCLTESVCYRKSGNTTPPSPYDVKGNQTSVEVRHQMTSTWTTGGFPNSCWFRILFLYSVITLISHPRSLHDQIRSLVSLWLFFTSLPVRCDWTTPLNVTDGLTLSLPETPCLCFPSFCSAWISHISPQDRYLVVLLLNLVSCLPRKVLKGK